MRFRLCHAGRQGVTAAELAGLLLSLGGGVCLVVSSLPSASQPASSPAKITAAPGNQSPKGPPNGFVPPKGPPNGFVPPKGPPAKPAPTPVPPIPPPPLPQTPGPWWVLTTRSLPPAGDKTSIVFSATPPAISYEGFAVGRPVVGPFATFDQAYGWLVQAAPEAFLGPPASYLWRP